MDRKYNVLFIISDQHRWDCNGFAGHPIVKTPNLDKLAESGVIFNNAYCPSPVCICSRASIMTGVYPHIHREIFGTGKNPDQRIHDMPTLGTVFSSAGYATGAIGKVHIPGETKDETRNLGFQERGMRIYTHWFQDYIDVVGEEKADAYAMYRKPLDRYQKVYNPTNEPVTLEDHEMYDSVVVDQCVKFMEVHKDEPFFLWAGLEKPHTDWTAPKEYHDMYDPKQVDISETALDEREDMPENWYVSLRQRWAFKDEEVPNCVAAYYANVTYLDAKIGILLESLERLGLKDNTIVVYTTDHGEMLFDHGMVQKQNFFEGSVRVPFIIYHPEYSQIEDTCHEPVSLLDLFPTFCELTGVDAPEGLEGESISKVLTGEQLAEDRAVFSEFYSWQFAERMIVKNNWKYIYSHGQICQLYNLNSDPEETTNLIDAAEFKNIKQELHQELMKDWQMPEEEYVKKAAGAWNDPDEWRQGFEQWKNNR